LGRVLASKYRLDQEIGAGAMGRVYRARQLDLARDVAVKILHPMMASDEGAQLRFAREAKVAARLTHPAAVSVLDYGIDHQDGEGAELAYLVMELMVGETLRERLSRQPMPRADALTIASDVADALIAAHEIRLIHRDLKPENIFLQHTPWGERVRVVDFGLAFLATGETALGRMTQEGFVGGTPAYMAPEQVHGRGVGPAADIYGLGCMLYELVAGHPPFRGSLAELLTSQAYAPPRPLRILSLTPPVSPELDRLVMAMLSKTAPMRPGPQAVWQTLQDLAADTPSRATAPAYISARSARALGRTASGTVGSAALAKQLASPIAQGSGHAALLGAGEKHSDAPIAVDATLGATSGVTSGLEGRGALPASMASIDLPVLPSVKVAALGELPDDLELGLIAVGCIVEKDADAETLRSVDVIWAPGATDERVRELARIAPVVTDLGGKTAGVQIDDLLHRLRAGAADLMIEEPTPDQLARKLLRAARRPQLDLGDP
jgi:eukaryotic-like serine/threonine-protein kinase